MSLVMDEPMPEDSRAEREMNTELEQLVRRALNRIWNYEGDQIVSNDEFAALCFLCGMNPRSFN